MYNKPTGDEKKSNRGKSDKRAAAAEKRWIGNGEHGFGAFAPNFLSADGRIRYRALKRA